MTNTTVAAGENGTPSLIALVASTVDTVTFTKDQRLIEVVHPGATADGIWYTNDGSTPTVGGKNCFFVPSGAVDSREPVLNDTTGRSPQIKLISSGTPTYRVQRGS